ncbi:MAG: outer membrane protein assembly factor BamE [Candidatus Omnitrophota bacterium]
MKKLSSLVCLLLLTGCMSMGQRIDVNKMDQIKEGVTTQEEVVSLLGNPYGKHVTDNGQEKWDYVFLRSQSQAKNFIPFVALFSGGVDQEKETLQILFDKDGRAAKKSYNKSNDEIKMGIFS